MQSSIWKLVTAVGIIGIGTLVVLEVQHRLPQQRTVPVGQADGDQAVVEIGSPTQENDFVPAADSEFDRMFANAADGAALSDPQATASASTSDSSPPGSGDEELDNLVRRSALSSEPSPFALEEPAVESSSEGTSTEVASMEPASNRVLPVAFQEPRPESNPSVNPGTAVSGDDTSSTPTLSFDTPSNPFPDETTSTGNSGPTASTSAETSTAPTRPAEDAIIFFSGEPDTAKEGNDTSETVKTEAAGTEAIKTAEGTLSGFPLDEPSSGFPGTSQPAAEPQERSPFSESPFSEESSPAKPETEPSGDAFPAFDDTPPAATDRRPAGENPRRAPAAPIDDEPNPFERDNSLLEPEPSPFEMDSNSTRGGANRPSTSGGANRPARSRSENLEADIPALDLDSEPKPAPAIGDETFDGGALPFVPDDTSTEREPAIPDRTPSRTPERDRPTVPETPSQRGSNTARPSEDGVNAGTDFPPLPGIEVPGPRDPSSPSTPGDDPSLDPFPPGDSSGTDEPGSGGIGITDAQILRPHLTVEKKAPQTASVGIPLDYTIVVSNEGESAAADVIVEDELSRGVDLQTTSPTAEYDDRTRLMTWRIAELGPRESREIRVRVIPTGEGTLNGVATVRFKAQVKASTLITAPKLSIELLCPQEVRAGEQMELKYVVRNNGSGDARAVLLRSVLPENLRHPEGNDLEYEIEVLRAGEEQEVTLTVVAAERGECLASAELSTSGIQPVTTEARLNVVGELLKIERLGPEKRYVGRASQFQNIITNITNFEATNVVVMELVPEGMKFVKCSESGEYNPADRLITWKISSIKPGKQSVLDVELTPELAGSMDSIVQVVESPGFKSQAVKTVLVEDLHNIGADVSQIKGPVAVGEKFTFAITIDNRGTANATNVQLSVQLPKQLKVLAAGSKEQGIEGRPAPGNAVNFRAIQEVPPNSSKTFQLVLQGQEPVRNGVIKAELSYREMTESLVVSESVTVFSDTP